MNEKYAFVIFLIALIIVCAVLPHFSAHAIDAKERFTNSIQYDNNEFVLKKSCAYFPFVSTFIMSDSVSNTLNTIACPSADTTTNMPLKIFKFLPTYLDAMCSLSDLTEKSTDHCTNFYIDNNTFADPVMYDSQQICTTVNGTIGQSKEQSKVRILSNNYVFMKRCITLHIDDVYSIGGVSVAAQFQIVCKSPIDLFVLLRPCMISFPGFGLFNINMFRHGNNVPITNSATQSSIINYSNIAGSFTFHVSPITNATNPDVPIFPATTNQTLTTIAKNGPVYPTIYYFNYIEPADYFTPTNSTLLKFNTLTLVFDQTYLLSKMTTDLSVTMPTDAITNTCPQLSYSWNNTSHVFKVDVHSSLGTMDTLTVHSDFSSIPFSSSSMYHIVVTYSVDLLTIVTFHRDLSLHYNTTQVTMTQKAMGGVSPIYLQYPIYQAAVTGSAALTTDMKKDLTGYAAMCPQTVIPNYAAVAKQLGYSFAQSPM